MPLTYKRTGSPTKLTEDGSLLSAGERRLFHGFFQPRMNRGFLHCSFIQKQPSWFLFKLRRQGHGIAPCFTARSDRGGFWVLSGWVWVRLLKDCKLQFFKVEGAHSAWEGCHIGVSHLLCSPVTLLVSCVDRELAEVFAILRMSKPEIGNSMK